MPREYRCRKCGIVHPAPTGKHCRRENDDTPEAGNGTQEQILRAISDLQSQMQDMRTQMQDNNTATGNNDTQENDSEMGEEEASETGSTQPALGAEAATPDSLRHNIHLMAQAAGRIAQWKEDELDDQDTVDFTRPKTQGKKSGSLMVATDRIKHSIDWPHMHVRRMTNGKRRTLNYAELTPEEFVYGYLTMLINPRNGMDEKIMIPLLRIVMQDTVDYSWINARNFYETLGIEVEKGDMRWEDTETIREYRMTYSRAVFPETKDGKETKEATRPQPRTVPTGMKCCATFQKRTCEQNRDHAPFTHACAYCHRSASLMCRHPEDECIRKTTDASKNGKKGDA